MSRQPFGERSTTGPSSTSYRAEARIAPNLQPAEPLAPDSRELAWQARAQLPQSTLAPRQYTAPDQNAFRAPGVDAILTASQRYASQQTTIAPSESSVAAPFRHDRLLTGFGGAKHQPSGLTEETDASRRTSQSSQPGFASPDPLSPLHVTQAHTSRTTPIKSRSSSWLLAAPTSAPHRASSLGEIKPPERLPFGPSHRASAPFVSYDPRGSQANFFERGTTRRDTASSSSQGSPFSSQEGTVRPAPGGVRLTASASNDAQGRAIGEQSRKRDVSGDYISRGAEPQPPNFPPVMEPGTRYMTLQTEQGPMSFPVDVQAASRGADEKRKRNAGASARFRARRKEREQANSREIEELRQTIRDLGEDVEFYRRERDYMASALQQGPDRDRHFPRPVSPRRRRTSAQSNESDMSRTAGISQQSPSLYQERGERGGMERHSRQRLADDFSYGSQAPAMSPSSQASYSRERSFSAQQQGYGVPQLTPQPPPSLYLRQQGAGPPYTTGQTPQLQDSPAPRDLPRIYAPPASRAPP